MRNLALFLSLALTITFVSCQKEASFQDDVNNPGGVAGDFRVKIDGVQWVATKGAAATRANGLINISGLSNDNKAVIITLTDSGAHRYTLNEASLGVGAYSDQSPGGNPLSFGTNGSDDPAKAGGEVNITTLDDATKRIKGTFSFKVYREDDDKVLTMTEGSFDLSYATSVVLPPASTTDTFRAKVNGTPLTVNSIFSSRTGAPVDVVFVQGGNTNGSTVLGLTMPPDVAVGEYTLDFFGGTYIGQYNPDTNPAHSQASSSGTLKIVEHNKTTKRIRGTFEFHAESIADPTVKSEITEGYFSVKY